MVIYDGYIDDYKMTIKCLITKNIYKSLMNLSGDICLGYLVGGQPPDRYINSSDLQYEKNIDIIECFYLDHELGSCELINGISCLIKSNKNYNTDYDTYCDTNNDYYDTNNDNCDNDTY